MKIEIFNGYWTRKDIVENKYKVFIFGDNDRRYGKGGQAIIRDLNNTIGLRTKKAPNNKYESFYTDNEFELNKNKIDEDISNIKNIDSSKILVFSSGGYGTGLSRLPELAPKTYQYLCEKLLLNFNFDNDRGIKITK